MFEPENKKSADRERKTELYEVLLYHITCVMDYTPF